MATDKRARKKAHRDAQAEARAAAMRRRRNIRLGGVGLVLIVLVGMALFLTNDEGEEPNEPASAETTEPPEEATAACGAEAPAPGDPQQYEAAEEVLEDGVDYSAVLQTSCGTIELDLLEDEAPKTVNNFVFLANEGFYNGLTWHRIENGFVIQGGDPEGTGSGGPGYQFEDELPKGGSEYTFGTVAMANSGPEHEREPVLHSRSRSNGSRARRSGPALLDLRQSQ